MELVLAGLHLTTCLDDTIVFSKNVEEHLLQLQEVNLEEHLLQLQEVFKKLRNAGLKVKPKKCQLLRKQVQYLGHIVFEHGIATDPEKKAAVQNWPRSTNVHELKQFLGLAMEKGRKWYWDEDYEMSFQNLKICLTTTPMLCFPNFNYTFLVDGDQTIFIWSSISTSF